MKLAELKAPKKKHSAKKTKMKNLETISVKVDLNRISVSSRVKKLDKQTGDEVVWNCVGGMISITWPGLNGSPFNAGNFAGGAKSSIASGPIVGPPDVYKYTLTIYADADPTHGFSIDPQIEVDDSGLVRANVTD